MPNVEKTTNPYDFTVRFSHLALESQSHDPIVLDADVPVVEFAAPLPDSNGNTSDPFVQLCILRTHVAAPDSPRMQYHVHRGSTDHHLTIELAPNSSSAAPRFFPADSPPTDHRRNRRDGGAFMDMRVSSPTSDTPAHKIRAAVSTTTTTKYFLGVVDRDARSLHVFLVVHKRLGWKAARNAQDPPGALVARVLAPRMAGRAEDYWLGPAVQQVEVAGEVDVRIVAVAVAMTVQAVRCK
ncbi:hypothetical protein BC828DRAFT_409276 [Blastocladiella britannica]|nr:hypothetical protein BC828DRAFT_409276 [Blastocladiella britannica]